MSPLRSSNKVWNMSKHRTSAMNSTLGHEVRGASNWHLLSPDMIFYEGNFIALLLAVGFLLYKQEGGGETAKTRNRSPSRGDASSQETVQAEDRKAVSKFTRQFLIVYALVMGGDWLQGAHIYAIYKDQYGFPEESVARFFAAGFLSGAVSAYFVGRLADKFGRRFMCCVFCATYSLSCLSTLLPVTAYIYVGRMLGGLSTSILYSAFESWMVTEFHTRGLGKGGSLSRLLGTMTMVNSLVGIAAGVVSEGLVRQFQNRAAPFMAAIVCLVCACLYMMSTWTENYGDNSASKSSNNNSQPADENTPLIDWKNPSAIKKILSDKRILSLGFTSCFFEGSMYLFVYFWAPSLKATIPAGTSTTQRMLPYGLIFATFMASMMLGSLIFNRIMSTAAIDHSRLMVTVLLIAAMTFLVNIFFPFEWVIMWSFCVFEICVGMYYPTMGYLKGKIVEDSYRGAVYATLRAPLNIFVVCALAITREGDGHRNLVFSVCCALLVLSALLFQRLIPT